MNHLLKDRFLVCIDSDGCAIDSMTIKHEKAFGPAFVEVWQIPELESKTVLDEWNKMNLYSLTRGINRFQGLVAILKLHPELVDSTQFESLVEWGETTKALSAESLKEAYEVSELEVMAKALAWSALVNTKIEALPLAQPFEGVKEVVEFIKTKADIAVVSSANLVAIKEEWEKCGLYELVDHFFSQSDGTKSDCINQLLAMGYDRDKTIMIGDAIGDYKAAENNRIAFYPILAAKESMSWRDFHSKYFQLFLEEAYANEVQELLFSNMKQNLSD